MIKMYEQQKFYSINNNISHTSSRNYFVDAIFEQVIIIVYATKLNEEEIKRACVRFYQKLFYYYELHSLVGFSTHVMTTQTHVYRFDRII